MPGVPARTATVVTTVDGGVAHVRLSRPDKLNALTVETLRELVATARTLRRQPEVRVVVLSGRGRSFCAGLDVAGTLRSPAAIARGFVPVPWRGTNLFQEACWAWRRLPVPVIAAVHGHCLGGGLQLALAADVRIAAPDSTWSVLEGRWGLVPDMTGIATLRQVVGADVAKLLIMTARRVDGEEALRLGLVTELAADPGAAADALARELLGRSPDALAAAKRLVDGSWTAPLRRVLARERLAQLPLLVGANARVAREAAAADVLPLFRPRRHR